MAANGSPLVSRLNPVDRLGRTIDPEVLAAAEEIFPRALEHGLKLLGDSAVIANALEEVAAAVTRVVSRTPQGDPAAIKNLPGYVFRAFVRHVNRLRRKQLVLVSSNGDGQASTPRWADPSRDFETKILVDECLAQCDFVTQDMFWRRMQGFSWAEIGKIHGLSGHAAEVRFRHALRRAQARLGNGRRSLPCKTRADRSEELKSAMRTDAEK
jgi:DNA-directed RNA polymerase specialized sigma24 family protein